MLERFRDGGWGMWPILIFGLLTLGSAFRFMVRVDAKLLGFVEMCSRAVLYASLTGFVTGLISTVGYINRADLRGDEAFLTLLTGAKESANNLAFGLAILTLVHIVLAVGRRRLDARAV